MGITASMSETGWGICACDTDHYPFGTQFIVEDMDTVFVCEDRGGAIKGNRLDLWYPSCWLANWFGIRHRWAKVIRKIVIPRGMQRE